MFGNQLQKVRLFWQHLPKTKYLADEPYRVYKDLISSDVADKKIAGAVLYILVSDVLLEDTNDDFELLSGNIQKNCGLNKWISDRLVSIFGFLYSKDNKESWKAKSREGLTQFLSDELTVSWEGFAS